MKFRLEHNQLDHLFKSLQDQGYSITGPTVRDGAIVYSELQTAAELPQGLVEIQNPGKYELKKRQDQAYFGFNLGPDSLKKIVFPPKEKLFSAIKGTSKKNQSFTLQNSIEKRPKPLALFGVRACDLKSLEILDKVFLGSEYKDSHYQARREGLFFIAVQCATAASTCFCHTMNSGPEARSGFDLALTEVIKASKPYFIVEVGSARGKKILKPLNLVSATVKEQSTGKKIISETVKILKKNQGIDQNQIKKKLYQALDSPHWEKVADRCLSCANCTLVCPTCFCSTTEDATDLKGENAGRWRKWDSCFTLEHSHIHGGAVRPSVKSRYRQWLTHKLASWQDQFGSSGCVGCGRCVSWCPVGIDLREEVKELTLGKTT